MSSNAQVLLRNWTIAPSASTFVTTNMEDVKYCRLGLEVGYAATGSSTGVTCTIYTGINSSPTLEGASGGLPQIVTPAAIPQSPGTFPFFGDNSTNSVVLSTITPSATAAQTKRTMFYLDFPQIRMGGLVQYVLVNTDAANTATVSFYADIS